MAAGSSYFKPLSSATLFPYLAVQHKWISDESDKGVQADLQPTPRRDSGCMSLVIPNRCIGGTCRSLLCTTLGWAIFFSTAPGISPRKTSLRPTTSRDPFLAPFDENLPGLLRRLPPTACSLV